MTNVLDLVGRSGIELRKASTAKGGEYQGPCPGCGGNDRFHVWPEQNISSDGSMAGSYWCRQCGKKGDCIQFLRDFEGLSFREACDRLGRQVPDSRRLSKPTKPSPNEWEPTAHEGPAEIWQKKAMAFVTWSFEQLFDNQKELDWLMSRGIREESIARYALGWNPGDEGKDLFRAREAWGLSKKVKENGRARALWLPIGMVIPSLINGRLQRIRIRRPEPKVMGPKYYVVPGSSMGTMVLEPERKTHMVVESELDAILIAQEATDLTGAVAVGSASTKPDDNATRVLKSSLQILVALDFDGAGAKAWPWWKENFPDCERWPVPKGKDPGEAFQKGIDLREWIKAGLPPGLR